MPTDMEIAWAAGLFEGEGCFVVHQERRYVGVSLASTDLDVVKRFQAIVGFGKIHKTSAHLRPAHWKPCYQWYAWNAPQTRQVVAMFWDHLGERRRARAQEILDMSADIGSRGRSKYQTHCKRGHEFTEENTYRQKNPRSPKGWTRKCRQCDRAAQRHRYQALKHGE